MFNKKKLNHEQGYTRSSLKGEDYPAITYTEHGQVSGVLAQGLEKKDIEALDVFEGDVSTSFIKIFKN